MSMVDVHVHGGCPQQCIMSCPCCMAMSVPHSKSGMVPRSSLLGAGQFGVWEVGKGGTIG
jgi:hypothetical protein